MIKFEDMQKKTALVTGASKGIGRATCRMLIDQGVHVFGIDKCESSLKSESHYHQITCDLSNVNAIQDAIHVLEEQVHQLDYLVNNAGYDPKYSIEEGGVDQWDQLVDLNLRGYYMVIRHALPLLRCGQGKAIVNVSSINYRLGIPKRSIYAVTKAGILGLTTGLARELGAESIRINTISPGWVFTERQVEEYFTKPGEREVNLQTHRKLQAIGHKISPEDVASHILFYLSDASAASTGHNCVVDGGWLLE